MLKGIAFAALAATTAFVATPALADDHMEVDAAALDAVLSADIRAEDHARDTYRHPKETLEFFRVAPDMTVVEYAPGGGWYTRVLAPYVAERGKYIATSFGPYGDVPERFQQNIADWDATFPAKAAEMTGVPADRISAYFGTEVPEDMNGTADRVLVVRMMHNLLRWNIADSEAASWRRMLKDDGLLGIVQHEAPEGMEYGKTDGNLGYLQKSDVIAMMKLYGFELVEESFINANPADTADHPSGVWTLPPTYARKDEDRETYAAIGESNRMTLLFKKAQ